MSSPTPGDKTIQTQNFLTNKDWDTLLRRIAAGRCTPFLGAGACQPTLPAGSDIAQQWAQEHDYPLEDGQDLARVAQFLAVDRADPMFPKEDILRFLGNVEPPNFKAPDEPHGLLADLPLPVYITTNYDNFMMQALRDRYRDPTIEICRWNEWTRQQGSTRPTNEDYEPSAAQPLIYHLHGNLDITESMVLTEDDYLDFLVNLSRNRNLLPPRVQRALTGASLLFIGYSLRDWNFRVLYRGLLTAMENSLRRMSVSVQLPPGDEHAQRYLDAYFKGMEVRVYWGNSREFVRELRQRWSAFSA